MVLEGSAPDGKHRNTETMVLTVLLRRGLNQGKGPRSPASKRRHLVHLLRRILVHRLIQHRNETAELKLHSKH